MVGGVGGSQEVGEEERGMVAEARPAVERHRGVTYEAFEPLEMKTQVVAGTNYFVKVRAAGAGARALTSSPAAMRVAVALRGGAIADQAAPAVTLWSPCATRTFTRCCWNLRQQAGLF